VRLLWDDENLEHIARHNVEPWEVEEAIADRNRRKFDAYNVPFEKRRGFIGKTLDGRILVVVLVRREDSLRPFMARDANEKEKGWYKR